MQTFSLNEFTRFDSQYENALEQQGAMDCSILSGEFRRELLKAINKGALSRCETLLETLEEGECKRWLKERLAEIDFETIRDSILSA